MPDNYPVLCSLPVNRPVIDNKIPDEHLLGALPQPETNDFDEYGPTTWGADAYAKSFEKFYYAEPSDFENLYPEETRFADIAWMRHFNYLADTRVIHMTATTKNLDSTPAYPKMCDYSTEREYIEDYGWAPYIREFSRIDRGAKPRVLWYLFMKKEVIKQSKIDDGDIRQILCSDPIYARIGACLEQHQNALMKQETETSSGQCGWSPFAGGFQQRIRRLEREGNKYIEIDWTRFDGTIPPRLFKRIKMLRWRLINKTQRERYKHVHKWYVREMMDRMVLLPSGEVTRQKRGNPSGQISTTMDNNMVNYWLQAFEFAYLNGCDWDKWRHYDTIVYGDDRLTSTPVIPENYVEKVCKMYKDIFGMWVKPEKVKVSDKLEGLSFCGFTIGKDYVPKPSAPYKLMAGLLKPSKKLPDAEALHGKLLSYQILTHYEDDEHPFKVYINKCLAVISELFDTNLPKRFTEEQLDVLWRGGPKSRHRNGEG